MAEKNPHDKLFKQTFSIRSEVKAFIKIFLPQFIGDNLDFRTLKQSKDSFITEELEEYFSDIIYSCKWKSGRTIQLSFLLEHKSYVPKIIYLQLNRYLVEAYQHQFQETGTLTLLIPIVVYHGKEHWEKRAFADYFDLPDKRLKQYIPFYDYELIDLSNITDDWIIQLSMGHYLKSTFLVFKHKDDKEFIKKFSEEIFIFVRKELSKPQKEIFFKAILKYIFGAYKFDRQEFNNFSKNVAAMFDFVPGSLYDQAVNEGLEKGLEKGKEIGKEIGEKIGKEIGLEKGKEIGLVKGKEIGLEKGKEIGKTFQLIEDLLDYFILFPKLPLKKLAKIKKIDLKILQKVKKTMSSKKIETTKQVLMSSFFPKEKLTKKELAKIDTIIKNYQKKLKANS